MTKEEAIKIINCYDIGFYDLSGEKIPADKLAEAFDMATEALERTDTHECVNPTHSCVEPVGNSDQLNRTCAECKFYTEEHLCVFWSYFGFEPNDCCSRWEGKE